MPKPLVIIGSGGHASVIAEILLNQGREIVAVVSPIQIYENSPLKGITRLASDESLLDAYSSDQIELINGIGAIPGDNTRFRLFNYFSEHGYTFSSVISPYAIVASSAKLAHDVQIMHGAIIQTNANINQNCLINSGAVVEHDCSIGSHNHIAPNATLSGGVVTGSQVHIGTGANIIQSIKIGQQSVVGAGCTVVRDIPEKQVIVPARNRILR